MILSPRLHGIGLLPIRTRKFGPAAAAALTNVHLPVARRLPAAPARHIARDELPHVANPDGSRACRSAAAGRFCPCSLGSLASMEAERAQARGW
jgi:hypothetical protein